MRPPLHLGRHLVRRGLLLAALGFPLAFTPCAIADPTDETPAIDAAVEAAAAGLGTNPDARAVKAGVNLAVIADEPSAKRFLGALWHARGPAAAAGFVAMSEHESTGIQRLAVEGIARAGLRSVDAHRRVHRLLEGDDKPLQIAAMTALGRIGQASDVPVLLERADTKDMDLRTAAFRALEALTSQAVGRELNLWKDWWTEVEPTTSTVVPDLLEQMKTASADVQDALRSELERHAWCDVVLVEKTARQWIRSDDPAMRAHGFGLFTAARLADSADEVASGLRYERHPDTWDAALAAARALGLPAEDVKRPETFQPDRRFDR